jgi:hypothetical protein
MSASANPDIVDDGLVFLYDTDDGKSYKGEPTTNLFPSPQLDNNTNTTVGEASITLKNFGSDLVGLEMIQAATSNIVVFSMGSLSSAVSGGTYTWSSYVNSTSIGHKVKAQVTVRVDGVRYWLTNSNTWTTSTTECTHLFAPTIANEWHRVDTQFTMPTGTLTEFQLGGWYRSTSNFTLRVANAQLELKSHATPFVNGTRSATQGLIDRTGNSTIDLSNVSFDSNAQMAFDGTDDYALTTFTPSADDNKTISVWVNFDILTGSFSYVVGLDYSNSTDGFIPISVAPYNGNWVLRMRQQLGTLGTNLVVYSNLIINTGEWINLVISSNGSAFNFYKNGVKGSAVSGTNNGRWFSILNEPIMIGASDWLTNQLLSTTDGKIANVSIYNKQLTDAEVLQNYNATKSRFNL